MSEALLFAEYGENMLCTKIVLNVRNNFCTQHVLPRFELGIFMYCTCNAMNNLSSHCGLVDVKIRASDKDLPVTVPRPLSKVKREINAHRYEFIKSNTSKRFLVNHEKNISSQDFEGALTDN